MSLRSLLVAVPFLCLAAPLSRAAEPEGSTEAAPTDAAAPARKAVGDYLAAVKTKKWDVARKQLHPRRVEEFSGPRKKDAERHALAAWAHLKEHYLTGFALGDAGEAGEGAFVVTTVEDHFSVEDNGSDEGVKAEYLVLSIGDRWFVVDRRLGEGVFPARNLRAAYKDYFDYVAPVKAVGKKAAR